MDISNPNGIVHNDASSSEVAIAVGTDDTTRIDVTDNGPRIPEMERNILLDSDPEHQTPLYHGTGLWLIRLIVTRSNGCITFRKNSPRGNTVRVERTKADATPK